MKASTASHFEPLELRRDAVEQFLAKFEIASDSARHPLARHVVHRWPKPARRDDDLGAAKRQLDHVDDALLVVANRGLVNHTHTDTAQFLRDVDRIRIHDVGVARQ